MRTRLREGYISRQAVGNPRLVGLVRSCGAEIQPDSYAAMQDRPATPSNRAFEAANGAVRARARRSSRQTYGATCGERGS